ncbi:hypothetical protein DFH09DRAFT_1152360 [Mycena vulgaris]|nr:hypothetical protein DFH09DRAFT_1152360 [Mycena vulgaris]
MHVISVVATILVSTAIAARGSPLPPSRLQQRAPVKFHILTGEDAEEACSPAQVTAIKDGIADAKKMSDVAIKTLKVKNMNKSNGFFHLFGGSSVSAADISERFTFVKRLTTPDEVTSLDAFEGSQDDVVFTCIPATNPKAGSAYANTVNIGVKTKGIKEVPKVNLMRFGTFGLKNTESFTTSAARIKAATAASAFPLEGAVPLPLIGFTLIHEVQHCNPMLDNPDVNHFIDEKVGGDGGPRAYGINQVQNLTPVQKTRNPQNYAWFALLAESNPEFFEASCAVRPDQPVGGVTPPVTKRALELFQRLWARVTKAKPKAKVAVKAKAPAKKVPVKAKVPAKAPVKVAAPKKVPAKPVSKVPTAKPATKAPVKKVPVKSAAKPATGKTTKPVAKPPAKAGATKKVPAKSPTKPVTGTKPPVKKPVTGAKPPVKKPTIPVKKPIASKSASSAAAKPSKAVTTPKAPLSCPAIKKAIPGKDQKFLDFDDE